MKQNFTMPFTESAITLDLTGYEYFAFENCVGYQRRSAHNLGEMDIGWYEPSNQHLYIAELKDYSVWLQATEPKLGNRAVDLFHKSLSVIAMLTAVRTALASSLDIDACLPPSWPRSNPAHLIHIIHCAPADEIKLSFVNDKLKEIMRPQYLELFNIVNCLVISHRQAKTAFPDIIS
ncbi:hypothetical protein [Hymenobacter baengnokdamensis]|uniref:hypothetical protein n=1 Tax=Hymenobacter baengnokdamensis TaxID=2615203 RepID=UPI001243F7F5|nr:hypothetical protein [Hymenobacter baengnokdamensis]